MATRLRLLVVTSLYDSLLLSVYDKAQESTKKFPKGLQIIIANNYVITSSISEISKNLTWKAFRRLSHGTILDFLRNYEVGVPLKASTLIADIQKFRLPYSQAMLVIPYLKFLLINRASILLVQNSWGKTTEAYAKTLIKNFKLLSSNEMKDAWLEFCYPNRFLSVSDKSNNYRNLSTESKAFTQLAISKIYGLNVKRFVDDYHHLPKEYTTLDRIRVIVDRFYRRYMPVYFGLILALLGIVLTVIYLLTGNVIFTVASLPVAFLSIYELGNTIIRPYIPSRPTLALSSKRSKPSALVAACIPFVVSNLHDLDHIKTELHALHRANQSNTQVSYFALIDFADSFAQNDEYIVSTHEEIDKLFTQLNSTQEKNLYFYFLRKNIYSQRQQRYMGWERKRGKFVEFIKHLYGEELKSTVFTNLTERPQFKYAFFMDEGGRVSKEIIKELLLRAENAANQPLVDQRTGTVRQGFGIFQPKVSSKQDFNKTIFQQTFNRFEKYHTYTSTEDVTFSLWGNFYFQGKGLINIEMYKQLCIDKFPEDLLLSHDLIEGSYLRVAYVDDCTIFEPFPSDLNPYLQRANRWMRGDFNTILWLFPPLRLLSIRFNDNKINGITRFRIFVNLLNVAKIPLIILTPLLLPDAFVGLIGNWILSQLPWFYTLIKELFYFLTKRHTLAFKLFQFRRKIDYWRLYELLSLPLQATNAIHAGLSSFIRLFITKQHTLTWVTSRRVESLGTKLTSSFLFKLFVFLLVVVALNPFYGLLLTAMAIASVLIAEYLNRRIVEVETITAKEVKYLRRVARLTWNFFETYVTADTNYLPPDHVTQGKIASYTSITNIGFYFVSLMAAHRLDIIKDKEFLSYFRHSFSTLTGMSTFNGQFYNWYYIGSLRVYPPSFLSSVDSGNFYACLVCVRQYLHKFNRTEKYIKKLDEILKAMNFEVYFNKYDQLSMGYYTKKGYLSKDNYDHFASESRLAVYVAMATEDISSKAWGTLLRPFNADGALLSWGGTIFEYLLPHLFVKTYADSLESRSFGQLLEANLRFGYRYQLPWGLSESLYVDTSTKTYEYTSIGISELSRDPLQVQQRTIAPYATALMTMVDVHKAVANLTELEELNMLTQYGFQEAVTFSKRGKALRIDSHMSHHQGMIMASILNVLTSDLLVRLFNSYSTLGVIDYLLDEDIPDYPEIVDYKGQKFKIERE